MAKLTISDAARACRVARSTLQRAVHAGRLSLDPDHHVDTAELIRAGYTLHAALQDETCRMRHAALQDAAPRSSRMRQDVTDASTPDAVLMQHTIAALERENALLRAALDAAAAREQDARTNAQAARDERALLLQMLQDMQHRYGRLLDMPRPSPQDSPGAAQIPRRAHGRQGHQRVPTRPPGASGTDTRGTMRRRIVTLLTDHPEGLTPADMQARLGVERTLVDVCQGMLRYGLIRRVARGRYALP
jgi:hypothetical protein